MSLSKKANYHLQRTLELARQDGVQIFGFIIGTENDGEIGRFSAADMSEDSFIEAIAETASLFVSNAA